MAGFFFARGSSYVKSGVAAAHSRSDFDSEPSISTPISFTTSYWDCYVLAVGLFLSLVLLFVFYNFGGGSNLRNLVCVGYAGSVAYFSAKLFMDKPWAPLLIATSKGIFCRRFSNKIVPWSAIENIGVLRLATGSEQWRIDIRIRSEADRGLVKRATSNSALLTHVPGKPNISISGVFVQSTSYLEMANTLKILHRYYNGFDNFA